MSRVVILEVMGIAAVEVVERDRLLEVVAGAAGGEDRRVAPPVLVPETVVAALDGLEKLVVDLVRQVGTDGVGVQPPGGRAVAVRVGAIVVVREEHAARMVHRQPEGVACPGAEDDELAGIGAA